MGDIGCSTAELSAAVAGYWSVNSLSTIGAGQRTTSGMVRVFLGVTFVRCVSKETRSLAWWEYVV